MQEFSLFTVLLWEWREDRSEWVFWWISLCYARMVSRILLSLMLWLWVMMGESRKNCDMNWVKSRMQYGEFCLYFHLLYRTRLFMQLLPHCVLIIELHTSNPSKIYLGIDDPRYWRKVSAGHVRCSWGTSTTIRTYKSHYLWGTLYTVFDRILVSYKREYSGETLVVPWVRIN